MNKELNKERRCKNCVHYTPHYLKRESKFYPLGIGRCMNMRVDSRLRQADETCGNYLERDFKKEKDDTIQSAMEHLVAIDKSLNEFVRIFQTLINENKEHREGY